MPYGRWCQFIAASSSGAATLYNVSVTNAKLAGSVPLPPADTIVSLHVDANTGTSYFTALTGTGAAVMSVSNDGTAAMVVDLSAYLPAGSTIKAGGATHCSNKKCGGAACGGAGLDRRAAFQCTSATELRRV